MTDRIELGEDMAITQRECDIRFEMVKEIRDNVRNLSKTLTASVDEIKLSVATVCTQVSALETEQNNLESQHKAHAETHSEGSRNKAAWVTAVGAIIIALLALVFGVLNR